MFPSLSLLLLAGDDPAAILLLVAIALLIVFFFLKGSQDLNKLVAKAEAANRQGRPAEAEKHLRRIARLEPGLSKKQLPAPQKEANRKIFAQTFLTLGEICERKNARPEAFVHYRKARQLGAPLSDAAWSVLADGYADRQSKSDNALGAYLAYIHQHPLDASSAKIYNALEAACHVDEGKRGAECKQAIDLNRRVLDANPNLEWPYYYMAVAYLLEGSLSEAMTNLVQSQKLNPNRAMTYYWMGACHLQQPGGGDLAAAVDSFTRFLAFPQETPQVVKRQGKAAFELAKRLIEKIGGFETKEDCATGVAGATLDQAIQYLETAVARDDTAASYHFALGRAYSLRKKSDLALTAFRRAVSLAAGVKEYSYSLGREYFQAGRLDESRDALRQALATDPRYAEAHELLAQVCLRTGRYDEAEAHCKAAASAMLEPAPESITWSVERADRVKACLWQSLFQQGKFQEVIDEWERVYTGKRQRDHGPDAMYWLARCYSRLRGLAEALQILESQPKEPRLVYYSACALAGLGRFDEAQSRFQQAIGDGGEFAVKALLQSGHIFLRAGNIAAAGDSYDHALAKQPRDAEAQYAMGNLAYRMGELDVAADHFSRILADQPDHTGAQFALGVVSEARGDINAAIQRYESVAGKMNQGPGVRLGVLYCRNGRHADAVRILEPLYRAGVESDAVLYYLGRALLSLDRPSESDVIWSRLRARHPQDQNLAAAVARTQYVLGKQWAIKKDYAAAAAEWEKYLEQFPSDSDTSKDLAELYLRQALRSLASPEAEAMLDRAVARDGQNPRCGYYRALRLLKLGRLDECEQQFRATLEHAGDDPRVLYHLGLCLLLKGDSEEALRQLQIVASLEPGSAGSPAPQSSDYGRYASWAIANERIRHAQYAEADAALAGTV